MESPIADIVSVTQVAGVAKYRLSMTFVDGELKDWKKSTPIDGK